MFTQEAGSQCEEAALRYLLDQGLKYVGKNYRCRVGEIDLIMRDGQYFVFVEVRARMSNQYGGGLGSITKAKRGKILKATMHYLLVHQLQDKFPVRFDVVSIDGPEGHVSWIKDAFGVDY
jgi:putative endonuclease